MMQQMSPVGLAVRGIIAIIFGAIVLAWPGITLEFLILLFALFAIIEGLASIVLGFANIGEEKHWWAFLIRGMIGIIIGVVVLTWPEISLIIFIYIIALWAIVMGFIEIMAGVTTGWGMMPKWLLILAGIISIFLGGLFLVYPFTGIYLFMILLGVFALFFGAISLAASATLKKPKDGKTQIAV
ncbi:HdeD family acid-resistance protein [Patescibacteria group bacterium]